MTETELATDLYRQIAFSAAILGGFAMTFLSVLISLTNSRSRVLLLVTGAMASAAVLLVVSTLSATLLQISVQPFSIGFNYSEWPGVLYRNQLISELCLLGGILGLLAGTGLCGFIRNKLTGVVTSVPAMMGVILLLLVFIPTF